MGQVRDRIQGIDALKGIAAIIIAWVYHYRHFLSHSPNGLPFQGILDPIYTYGLSLVDLFFVISGFIFSTIYFTKINSKKVSLPTFMWKRVSRLYPLHLATLIFTSLILLIRWYLDYGVFNFENNDVYHFVLNLFLLQYGSFEFGFSFNGPSWAIAVEVFAYCVFFALAFFSKNKFRYLFWSFCMIGIGLFFAQSDLEFPFINWNIGRVLVGFFAGSLLDGALSLLSTSSKKIRMYTTSGALAIIIILLVGMSVDVIGFLGHQWMYVLSMVLYPLTLLVILNTPLLGNFFSLPFFTFLGKISYSVYLWHFPIQIMLVTLNQFFELGIDFSTSKSFFAYGALLMMVASISYYLFEKPTTEYLRNKSITKHLNKISKAWNS